MAFTSKIQGKSKPKYSMCFRGQKITCMSQLPHSSKPLIHNMVPAIILTDMYSSSPRKSFLQNVIEPYEERKKKKTAFQRTPNPWGTGEVSRACMILLFCIIKQTSSR